MAAGIVYGRPKFVNKEGAGRKGGEKCGVAGGVCEGSDAVEGEGGEKPADIGAAEGVDLEECVLVSAVEKSVPCCAKYVYGGPVP